MIGLGLTVAALYDRSDDSSGLFVIGVAMAMAMIGSLVVTGALSLLIASWKRKPGSGRAGH